jgi:hypothetical protein
VVTPRDFKEISLSVRLLPSSPVFVGFFRPEKFDFSIGFRFYAGFFLRSILNNWYDYELHGQPLVIFSTNYVLGYL